MAETNRGRPSSTLVRPRPKAVTQDQIEDMEEIDEERRIKSAASERQARLWDSVAKFLGNEPYQMNSTFPWLKDPETGWQLRVLMHFYKKNLCVDKYPNPNAQDRRDAALKADLFARNSAIRYKALFPENSLAELAEYL